MIVLADQQDTQILNDEPPLWGDLCELAKLSVNGLANYARHQKFLAWSDALFMRLIHLRKAGLHVLTDQYFA